MEATEVNVVEELQRIGAGWKVPSEKSLPRAYKASFLELFFFVMLVFGKSLMFWPSGFAMGYWEFFLSNVFISVQYICFTLSVAEMASILPFSGGSYGYVRCVLGPFVGYMVGFFESMEYIMLVAAILAGCGRVLTIALQTSTAFEPLYWLAFYLFSLPVMILDGPWFWRVGSLMAVWMMIFLLVFLFGNCGVAEINKESVHWPGGWTFVQYFSVGGWCYKGLEVVTLTSDNARDPGRFIPWALVACLLTMIFLFLSLMIVLGGLSPDIYHLDTHLPLTAGTKRLFQISERYAALLFAPAIFGAAYCFLFAAYRQLYAMASSGLAPTWLKKTYGKNHTPWHALVAVCAISYIAEVVLFYGYHQAYLPVLFTISMASSLPVYMCLMVSYVIYARKYSNMERLFRSPLGIPGAIFAFVVFGFAIITLVVFPKEVTVSTTFFLVATVLAVFYYILVAEQRQCFSTEEQVRFFKVYVSNISRRKRLHNRFMRKRKGWKAFLPAFFFHHLATVYVAASSVMASGGANSAGSATPECAHNELSGYSASSVEKNDPRNDNAIHDFHDNDEEMGRGRESELPTASAETSSSFRALLRSHPH
eukprot:scaffold7068_cov179-Ochromonas_danica.AAC.4